MVSCGYPMGGVSLRIVDEEKRRLPERRVGEVVVKSPALFGGYYGRPEETAAAFDRDGWFYTGDLAYLAGGQLFICGRKKDLIISGGRNIQPHHLEGLAQEVLGRYCRYTVAFGLPDVQLGTELPVLVCEMRQRPTEEEAGRWREAIQEQVMASFQLHLHDIGWVEPGWIVKTTSGKINRTACRQKYVAERPNPKPQIPNSKDQSANSSPAVSGGAGTPLERQLGRIWEEVLGVRPVSSEDNFFKLGGDSLAAVRLFNEIERTMGYQVPPAVLFQAPTVVELAGFLRQQRVSLAHGSLVPMRPEQDGGGRPLLFCVHALFGSVFFFYDLVHHLGADQPVYGLQMVGREQGGAADETIAGMAARYVSEIRLVQPEGPYFLCGYSLGGVIAFEMARQLEGVGQQVALVALLDTCASDLPGYGGPGLPWGTFVRQRIWSLKKSAGRAWREKSLPRLWLKRGRPAAGDELMLQEIGAMEAADEQIRSVPDYVKEAVTVNLAAFRSYVPKVYSGKVTLFRAMDKPVESFDRVSYGWGALAAGGVEVVEVAGTHLNLVREPHVRELAARLRECIGGGGSDA